MLSLMKKIQNMNSPMELYLLVKNIVIEAIFGSLIKNPKAIASFLAGFRTYVYYHIQASKCYLHSRVLRRINKGYRVCYYTI